MRNSIFTLNTQKPQQNESVAARCLVDLLSVGSFRPFNSQISIG